MLAIIQSLEVSFIGHALIAMATDPVKAVSGACATLISDAFMNPFDGKTSHTIN